LQALPKQHTLSKAPPPAHPNTPKPSYIAIEKRYFDIDRVERELWRAVLERRNDGNSGILKFQALSTEAVLLLRVREAGLQQPPVSGQFQDAVKQVFFHTQKILAQENADEAREQGGGNSVAAPARPSIAHYPQWYGCPMPGCQKEFCSVRRALEHLLGSEEKTDDILKGDGGLSLSLSSSSSNCCQHFDVGAWDRILGHCRVQQQQEKLSSGQLPSLGTVLGGCLARKSKTGSGPRKVPTLKELKQRA